MWYKNRSEFYGFTQDPKTLDYMIVTNDKNSFCSNCFEPFKDSYEKWCKKCNAKHFQQNFPNWTSRNVFIDKLIQTTQLNARYHQDVLEWIPYSRLEKIKDVGKREFGVVYKAIWLDGPIEEWSYNERKWIRYDNFSEDNTNDDIFQINKCHVELHSLNESSNLNENFLNKV